MLATGIGGNVKFSKIIATWREFIAKCCQCKHGWISCCYRNNATLAVRQKCLSSPRFV